MSSNGEANSIDQAKLEAFLGKVVTDFGAALSSSLVYIGQRLGLYKALAEAGADVVLDDLTAFSDWLLAWLPGRAAPNADAHDAQGRIA